MDKLAAAQLQVVLPGSRASFRRRAIDALRDVVPASGGFCFLGKDDGRAYADVTRLVDSARVGPPLPAGSRGAGPMKLSVAFGFDTKSVVATARRAYLSEELWRDEERAALPYFRDASIREGFTRALLLFLHEGGILFGLAGLERRAGEAAFGPDDVRTAEALGPFLVAGALAQMQYDELSREAAALRALEKIGGTVYVVDRDRKQVVWAADRVHGVDWDEDVRPIEEQLVDAVEQSLLARKRGDALPTPPQLPSGSVVAVARLEDEPVFGGARCAVVRVDSQKGGAPLEGLSRREREIARLLVAGYSGVNVAAISGLSENTVRTYVRRLYGKLGVNNRADLVRKLMSPSTGSAPSSQLAPTPDSSLAQGDDTLD